MKHIFENLNGMAVVLALMLAMAMFTLLTSSRIRRRGAGKVQFANIGEGTRESGHTSLIADPNAAPQTSGRFLLVKTSTDSDHFTTTTTNDVPLGINQDVYDSNNIDVPNNIAILGAAPGTQRVVTDGTITSGLPVKCGTLGRATAASNGDAGVFGIAFFGTDTSSSAGDIITIIPICPFKHAF